MSDSPILQVRHLYKEYRIRGDGLRRTVISPVNDVSFDILRGRTTALVGESGSGKSTLSRVVMRLEDPLSGEISLRGTRIDGLGPRAMRPHRRWMQMVFQNPLRSFDPTRTIGTSIREVMRLAPPGGDQPATVAALLGSVGLPAGFADLLPHRVSGGELQRASIARAISVYPSLLVLDEPTSALDVSIQGQVLSLLDRLQEELGMAYLMATHDLRVVRRISDEVIVLYRGRIVEKAPTDVLFADPRHPYTLRLLAAEHGAAGGAEPTSWATDEHRGGPELAEVAPGHWVREVQS